jgi:outer membrane receptor for ferric coprogen and ferric-rhodotorulic acid
MYQVAADHNLYISQTEIFKPQNARDVTGKYIDPVTGTNRELGLKSALLNGALQTSFAVFQVQQDNLAQNTNVPFPDRPIEMIYAAADGVESTGFELEVIGQISEIWKLSAGYSQFKAEDAAGTEVNTDHPRKKLNLFTTLDIAQWVPGLEIGGGVSWEGSQYSGIGAKKLTQDAFSLVNLMARYNVSEQFSVQLNIDNLFDETYFSQIGFFEQYGYGSPRHASLGMTYNF